MSYRFKVRVVKKGASIGEFINHEVVAESGKQARKMTRKSYPQQGGWIIGITWKV